MVWTLLSPVKVERLPDLLQPRASHVLFATENGEAVAVGGHTTGFNLLPSAEYWADGMWHPLPSPLYPHDGAFFAALPEDRYVMGGGSSEAFGIGQSWGTEVYDARQHSFEPLGILSRKRAYASAVSLPDGRVVVSGNWYADDSMEVLGEPAEKPVSSGRQQPYMLPRGQEELLCFEGYYHYSDTLSGIIDGLTAPSFLEPLFREWTPFVSTESVFDQRNYTIGEDLYLIPALGREGEAGILKVSGGHFSLLDTDVPIPKDSVNWFGFFTDRPHRNSYFCGTLPGVLKVLRINYDPVLEGHPAQISLLSVPIKDLPLVPCGTLLPDGNLLLAGGRWEDNFRVSAASFLVRLAPEMPNKQGFPWSWLIAGLMIVAFLAVLLWKQPALATESPSTPEPDTRTPDLGSRILELLEEKQLFLKKDLTKADIALALGSNVTYVTAAVNTQFGKSFTELVASYRIRYAQALMQQHPQMPLSEVADESGFASEKSFFRTFKAQTGLTPTQWKLQE